MSTETATIDYDTGDGTIRTVPTGQTVRVRLRNGELRTRLDRIAELMDQARSILEAFGVAEDEIGAALRAMSDGFARELRETNLVFHRDFPLQLRGPELRGGWVDELVDYVDVEDDECTGRDTVNAMPSTGKGDPFADLLSRIDDLTG